MSAEYWFRQHYRLPPTDPRFLAMSMQGIMVEFEAFHAAKGSGAVYDCVCGHHTFVPQCLKCGRELTGDSLVDQILDATASGKDLDIESILKQEGFVDALTAGGNCDGKQ